MTLSAELLLTEQIFPHVIQWPVLSGQLHRVGWTKLNQIWGQHRLITGACQVCCIFLSVACKTFTDVDFTDDVSLLASVLEIMVLALEILHEELPQLGFGHHLSLIHI